MRYKCPIEVFLKDGQWGPLVLCDDNGAFLHIVNVDHGGNVTITTTDLDGNPYVTVGAVDVCTGGALEADVELQRYCDDNAGVLTPYLVAYEYDEFGAIVGTTFTEIDGVTPYVVTGTTVLCEGGEGGTDVVPLCDDNGGFFRHVVYNAVGVVTGTYDTAQDGSTPYVVSGNVIQCVERFDTITNPNGTDQSISVTGVASTYAALGGTLHADTVEVEISCENAAVRYTLNGTAPTAGTIPPGIGQLFKPTDSMVLPVEDLNAAQFINNTGVTGYIQITERMLR